LLNSAHRAGAARPAGPLKYLLAVLAAGYALGCQPVEGDRILAKDLAAERSEFAALDPDLQLGYSPLPGITRLIRAQELSALLRRQGIAPQGPLNDACFERIAKIRRQPRAVAPEVERGDQVAVQVQSGAARLAFEAKAESSGHTGDSVQVRNPENGRLFQAKVEGKGKVVVQR
jgi:hypothetical protein